MKKNIDMSRAWRDEEYYLSLSDEERAGLGAHPSGLIDLDQADLRVVAGGVVTGVDTCSAICTPCPPRYCN